jgi:hypothetical protein
MRIALFLITTLFLLNSCKTITLVDSVPANIPKGYVEFYCNSFKFSFYDSENGQEIKAGRPANDKVRRTLFYRRMAAVAGEHNFVVKIGHGSREVSVDVEEGMILPLGIEVRFLDSEIKGTVIINNYEILPITVGKSFPVNINPGNIELLVAALNHSDWGTRWLAACMIGENPGFSNELIIDLLTELSEYDAVQLVAQEAARSLKIVNDYRMKINTDQNTAFYKED